MINFGLKGIEAYHRKHSPAIIEYFSTLAEKYGLIITGGSDFHAPTPNNGNIIITVDGDNNFYNSNFKRFILLLTYVTTWSL